MTPDVTLVTNQRCFGGWQRVYEHRSAVLGCTMRFGVYLPPQATNQACPALYWLSGLTCTEQNFITKAGSQGYAARYGLMVIAPDTSPRGCNLPGEEDSWDLGTGAGFYVNATQSPWASHYRMYDYVVSELPALIAAHFPVAAGRQGIFGHSMGGHGALVIGLRNPDQFQSISAFAPIVAPTQVPWGRKAFAAYLGDQESDWLAYDACHLVRHVTERRPLLVDQGDTDGFLGQQLRPELLEQACQEVGYPLTLRLQAGYDHSYYFIASFLGDHMAHHAAMLGVS